jgi:hypothetical protein
VRRDDPAEGGDIMKVRRRTLTKLGLFLLAGAVGNVGVAWGIALLTPSSQIRTGSIDRNEDWLQRFDAFADWDVLVDHRVWTGFGVRQSQYSGRSLQKDDSGQDAYPMQHVLRSEYGFPFRSMAWIVTSTNRAGLSYGSGPLEWRYAIVFGKWANFLPNREAPLLPLPVAFTGNAAIYALALFTPLATIQLVQRTTRRARGLCPRCKYPLADLPTCPECGETIRRKVAEG